MTTLPVTIEDFTPDIPSIRQSDRDEAVLRMWIFGRPESTARAYLADIKRLTGTIRKPLRSVMLEDLQHFSGTMTGLSTESQRRTLAAVKSYFSFAFRIGYLKFNPAAVLRVPRSTNELAARILTEDQIEVLMSSLGPGIDRAMVVVLYGGGLRIAEAVGLNWGDIVFDGGGAFLTVRHGKGGKARTIRLAAWVAEELRDFRPNGYRSLDPVFMSAWGTRISAVRSRVRLKQVAKAAGLGKELSPHFFRHSFGSHAVSNGAPIHLVQQTLGHASLATTGKYLHVRPTQSAGDYLPRMEKKK